jgi:hypothetical protein
MSHIGPEVTYNIFIHLILASVALFWTRNFKRNDMILSEYVFGVFSMYHLVAVGYLLSTKL